jgi:hypothetical protein
LLPGDAGGGPTGGDGGGGGTDVPGEAGVAVDGVNPTTTFMMRTYSALRGGSSKFPAQSASTETM